MTAIFLLFFSFSLISLFGKWLGKKGAIIVTLLSTTLSLIVACSLFYQVGIQKHNIIFNLGSWFWLGDFSFVFDPLSVTMIVLVTFILLLVQLYSTEYMGHDPFLPKFLSYLSFFGGTMMLMVVASNLTVFFLGWEGVGLSSYLLINFWSTRNLANKSAIKAILFNRVGDIALIIAIILLFWATNTTDFAIINLLSPMIWESNPFLIEIIAFSLFIAAIAKSAQLFLHPWLPDRWKVRLP